MLLTFKSSIWMCLVAAWIVYKIFFLPSNITTHKCVLADAAFSFCLLLVCGHFANFKAYIEQRERERERERENIFARFEWVEIQKSGLKVLSMLEECEENRILK